MYKRRRSRPYARRGRLRRRRVIKRFGRVRKYRKYRRGRRGSAYKWLARPFGRVFKGKIRLQITKPVVVQATWSGDKISFVLSPTTFTEQNNFGQWGYNDISNWVSSAGGGLIFGADVMADYFLKAELKGLKIKATFIPNGTICDQQGGGPREDFVYTLAITSGAQAFTFSSNNAYDVFPQMPGVRQKMVKNIGTAGADGSNGVFLNTTRPITVQKYCSVAKDSSGRSKRDPLVWTNDTSVNVTDSFFTSSNITQNVYACVWLYSDQGKAWANTLVNPLTAQEIGIIRLQLTGYIQWKERKQSVYAA